ncbi:MAG: class I SAM-dependent methyltransferase [Micrococcales bacterium]|nr:class I SAM-dependent methyltransferase [Micrococcales bacterium]
MSSTEGPAGATSRNDALWTLVNERHTDAAALPMWQREGIRWGLFGIPESNVRALPSLPGTRVVELGAGTAFFSAALARAGARPVAIDLNAGQLATAARCQRETGVCFPLVQADAERVPLRDGCADLVVSEHGASVWCDPARWVPEAARLLAPGGHLVFLVNSVLSTLCVPERGPATAHLQRDHTSLGRMEFDGVEHHPSHGQWLATLRANGFEVLALHELMAPADAQDHGFYEIAEVDWARRWPVEDLWVARRVGSVP